MCIDQGLTLTAIGQWLNEGVKMRRVCLFSVLSNRGLVTCKIFSLLIHYYSSLLDSSHRTNRIWPGLTEFGPSAVIVSSLSVLPATAVGQILLTLAKLC